MNKNITSTKIESLQLVERMDTPDVSMIEEAGYQTLLEREVVVRRLSAAAAQDPRTRGRFVRDARVLATMTHHNLVRVFDGGVTDDNTPYVVLEKLVGPTLQQRLDQLTDQRSHLDIEDVQTIVQGAADALEYVHRAGLLVNDLSPANIILTTDGRTVLSQLGQPLPENPMKASITTLAYAAPERLAGGLTDVRSDVYSLGVLLYHLLFGKLPFEGSAISILSKKQSVSSLPALEDPRAELPCSFALAHVLRQATSRQAIMRYASVTMFRQALDSAIEGGQDTLQLRARPSFAVQHRMQLRRRQASTQRGDAAVDMPVIAPVEVPKQSFDLPVLRRAAPAPRREQRIPAWMMEEEDILDVDVVAVEAAPRKAEVAPLKTVEPGEMFVSGLPVMSIDDPLMPGRDVPALLSALPYTILVPMPESGAEAATGHGSAAHAVVRTTTLGSYFWLVGLAMLSAMIAGAAGFLG